MRCQPCSAQDACRVRALSSLDSGDAPFVDSMRCLLIRNLLGEGTRGESMTSMFDDYTVVSNRAFDAAVEAVRNRAESNGFTVLATHDLQAVFGAKGFRHEQVAIVEICNEPFGSQMLAADPQMSLMMPCKVCVYAKEGKVHISALRPRLMGQFVPEFVDLAEQGDAIMCRIVDEAR